MTILTVFPLIPAHRCTSSCQLFKTLFDFTLQISDLAYKSHRIDSSVEERAMIVKNASGDYGILYGHWANMKRGVPGG